MIASIFESKIVPELEKAIANKIPEGVLVELKKLEINIGRIDEKELPEKLAKRIREALEDALNAAFDLKNRLYPGSKRPGMNDQGKYLLESLELFLAKGYFPFDTSKSFDIDALFSTALSENRKELPELIRKYARHESATKRIVYALNSQTIDKLFSAITPVDSKWITDFREVLIRAKKDSNFSRLSDAEFLQQVNSLILAFLLGETSLVFNRSKFSDYLLNKINESFMPDLTVFIQSVKRQTRHSETSELIGASLRKLHQNRNREKLSPSKGVEIEADVKAQILQKSGVQANPQADNMPVDELFDSLESFLLSGVVSPAVERFASIDELFSSALRQDPKRLKKLFQEYGQFDAVIRRIVSNTKTEQIEQLINVLNPAERAWISKFRNVLTLAKTGASRDAEFTKSMHFIILKQLLTNTQPFNRQSFSTSVLRQFADLPDAEFTRFADAVKSYPKETGIKEIIANTLNQIQTNKPDIFSSADQEKPELEKLIAVLNSGKTDFNSRLKNEIIRALSIRAERELFIQKLTESGLGSLLGVFYPGKGGGVHQFITSFISEVVTPLQNTKLQTQHPRNAEAAVEAAFYSAVRQNSIPDYEELLLCLLRSSGLDSTKAVKSEPFKRFVRSHKNISLAKLKTQVSDEKLLPEISTAGDLLTKKQPGEGAQTESTDYPMALADEYDTQLKRRILETYLISGRLPLSYSDLTQHDLQIIFRELIREKDEFLVIQLKKNRTYGNPAKHLEKLITRESAADTEAYLNQFFPADFSMFNEMAAELKLQLSPDLVNLLSDKKRTALIFIETLSESRENISPETIRLIAYKLLNQAYQSEIEGLVDIRQEQKKTDEMDLSLTQPLTKVDDRNFEEKIARLFAALKFFGNNGFFPWWTDHSSVGEITAELLSLTKSKPDRVEETFMEAESEEHIFEKLLSRISGNEIKELDKLFKQHKQLHPIWSGIKRKTQKKPAEKPELQFPEKYVTERPAREDFAKPELLNKTLYFEDDQTLLNRFFGFSPEIQAQLKNYLSLASEFQVQSIKPIQWRKAVLEFSLRYYKSEKSVPDKRFVVEFVHYLKTGYPRINWEESFSAVSRKLQLSKHKGEVTFPEELIYLFGLKHDQPVRRTTQESKSKTLPTIDENGLEVKVYNSGLVLFWPFLTRLFERLSLVENNAFVSPESRNRAVYILQYLVYNDIGFPEYNLVLNKLLAGMPPEEHLVPFIELTGEEKDATQSLLNGLIANWEKVKESSPEAIQETFLQREGTLKFQTDGVLLEVPKKTVDVLMSSIPWSISVVRLPWMKKPVYVKWT